MLTITRSEGQEIVIGNPAAPLGTIRIDKIRSGKVRISFDFPEEMPVHRSEVAADILREREEQDREFMKKTFG